MRRSVFSFNYRLCRLMRKLKSSKAGNRIFDLTVDALQVGSNSFGVHLLLFIIISHGR
jgi:hypothetical protein